jgi:hypothetical protein|tara:strand:+ start:3366 stop:3554 length:189 start_codon:yes stop_codon:yes gene_type:complete
MAEENSPNTDDKIVLLLEELIAEQKNTVASIKRHRGHLVFYTLMIILVIIVSVFTGLAGLGS